MAILKWDQVGQKRYETGISNVVLFTMKDDGTYDKGVAWNGVTNFTESPSGAEDTALYADNIKYLNLKSTEEFGATLEAYTFPDEFMECDGSAEVTSGMTLGQQKRRNFGLCYKTLVGNDAAGTDYGYKLHFVYGASAAPSEVAYDTVNDSPDAQTFSWEIATVPVEVGTINGVSYKPTATVVIDSTKFASTELKAKLQTLLDKVYGTDSTESELPTPAQIYACLTGTAAPQVAG